MVYKLQYRLMRTSSNIPVAFCTSLAAFFAICEAVLFNRYTYNNTIEKWHNNSDCLSLRNSLLKTGHFIMIHKLCHTKTHHSP